MALIEFKQTCFRLISSSYPPIDAFEGLGTSDEISEAKSLESATNDRLTNTMTIPEEDRAVGTGGIWAMAPFLHPTGGRFNGDKLGAWYAALSIETAIRETLYHHSVKLRHSKSGFPNKIQMRELQSSPIASLFDITGIEHILSDLYNADNYDQSQLFGAGIRDSDADGILYNSVRHDGGTNIVIYRPRILTPVTQADHYEYIWNSQGEPTVVKITNVGI